MNSTYYLEEIQNPQGPPTLWWLGLSEDRGRSFASVFHGTVSGDTANGSVIYLPLGQQGGSEQESLQVASQGLRLFAPSGALLLDKLRR